MHHVRPEAVSTVIRAALEMAGSNVTAHQPRDTAPTRMKRTFRTSGDAVEAAAPHIQSTMVYTQASNEDLQEALGGLDQVDTAQRPPRLRLGRARPPSRS